MNLAENFKAVRRRIGDSCSRVDRDPTTVTLLAVSKGMPPELVDAAVAVGQVFFGESKVQEAKAKIPQCSSRARWHMVGHLQSNKCRDAVQWFEMIHSVDSLSLAEELNKWADKIGKTLRVLLEVNIAGEATKFGFKPEVALEQLEAIHALPRLDLGGLMTIAPWTPNPEKARPAFRRLRELRFTCEQKLGVPLPQLSMGMSGDFEVAIEEGATLVRVGTALFGIRPRMLRPDDADAGP